MQLRRCLIISLLKRDVLRIMFAVFSSFGEVLNTTHGMSDKIVRLIELAILTFTPLNVNLRTEKYTGKSMKEAHAGLNLTDQHWQIVCDTLVNTLKELHVQNKEI